MSKTLRTFVSFTDLRTRDRTYIDTATIVVLRPMPADGWPVRVMIGLSNGTEIPVLETIEQIAYKIKDVDWPRDPNEGTVSNGRTPPAPPDVG